MNDLPVKLNFYHLIWLFQFICSYSIFGDLWSSSFFPISFRFNIFCNYTYPVGLIPFHAFFLKKLCLFLLLWFYTWNKCKHETADSDAITDWQPLPPRASIMCLQLYENFVEEVDAVDNGISQYDGEARYSISTTLSARVSHLNPRWNSTDQDTEVSTCECSCTLYQDRRWLLTCVWLRISYMGLIIVIICLSLPGFPQQSSLFLSLMQ